MNRKEKNSIWIQPHEVYADTGKTWIIPMISALLAVEILVLTLVELTGFADAYTPWGMVIAAGGAVIVYGTFLKLNIPRLFYPVMLTALMLLVILFGKPILNGGCAFWNRAGDSWTAAGGRVVPEMGTFSDTLGILVFSVFLGIVIALACCALASWNRYVLAVLIPMVIFTGMALFHCDNTFLYMIPCLLIAVCLLVCGDDHEGTLTSAVGRWIPVVICSLLLLFTAASPDLKQWCDEMGEYVHDKLHALRYETEYTMLPEGDFSDYKEDKDGAKSALVVTMEQPEEVYLRGFTGAVFSQDSWHALDSELLAQNEDFLYWMNCNGWNPQMQLSHAASLAETEADKERRNITVQNMNACSAYLYVPYSFCSEEYLEAEEISSDGVKAGGNRMYTYSVLPGGTDRIGGILKTLKNSDDEKVEEYRQIENAYREFVYSCYLDVPEEVRQKMLPYWEKVTGADGKKEEINSAQAQEYVRSFLEECLPQHGGATGLPLPLEVAQGSSFQSATVAVMTLRYFGIPSRYAEGYVITQEMAEGMKESSSIQIDGSCAGAWAEVYHDGVGWVPMDMTPGITEQKSSSAKEDEEGDEPEKITPKGATPEKPDDMAEEPQPGGGYVVSIQTAVSLTFLLFFAGALLLLMVLAMRRHILLKRRAKRWETSNRNDAVAWIFADAVQLLNKLGFDRGGGSMTELLQPVEDRLGAGFAETLKEMTDINSRAIFSNSQLEEVHVERAVSFYHNVLEHLKADAKWHRKLWMQWVLCLY